METVHGRGRRGRGGTIAVGSCPFCAWYFNPVDPSLPGLDLTSRALVEWVIESAYRYYHHVFDMLLVSRQSPALLL